MEWKPIAIYPNSKIPIGKGWNIWSYEKNKNFIKQYKNCNIGLLLGEILDVEGDTPNANKILFEMIKDYKHPIYKSNKSYHHLFLNIDNKIRRKCAHGIEFRGYGHQSLLPPSNDYEWISFCKVPPMPKRLIQFYKRNFGKLYISSNAIINN